MTDWSDKINNEDMEEDWRRIEDLPWQMEVEQKQPEIMYALAWAFFMVLGRLFLFLQTLDIFSNLVVFGNSWFL